MRCIHFLLIFTLLTPFVSLTASAKDNVPHVIPLKKSFQEKKYRDNEVIVRYKDATVKDLRSATKNNKSTQDIERSIGEKKTKILHSLKNESQIDDLLINDHINDLGVSLISSKNESVTDIIKKLEKNDLVEHVEPNYIRSLTFTPNDPFFSYQWAHDIDDPDADHDIDSTEAWDIENSSASDTIVAVIDSGVDHNFPDLSNNMWDGSSICLSDTGTTISCPYHGWDYENNDNDPSDDEGHGTFVASIIGASTNNATGMAGISRYNHVKVMAIRFGLDTFSEIRAINFAKNNGAKVINASFAGDGYSQIEKDAIDAFPGIVVAAAGNGGDDEIGDNNDINPLYPCNYTSTNLICVGATEDHDNITSFSNYGDSVDLAAPGQDILGIQKNSYWYGSGTSFSAPLVAGTAGILFAQKPLASISTIRDSILYTSDHLVSLSTKISCGRRLNVKNALESVILNSLPIEKCLSPVYRFWSSRLRGHFYTISETEKNTVIDDYDDSTWLYEGIGFYAYKNQISGTSPVYRFWSPRNQHHFYTISETEKNKVINEYDDFIWTYEGVAYYAYTTQQNNTTPIYRFWSPTNLGHFFTSDENEKNKVLNEYDDSIWTYEGVGFYIPLK